MTEQQATSVGIARFELFFASMMYLSPRTLKYRTRVQQVLSRHHNLNFHTPRMMPKQAHQHGCGNRMSGSLQRNFFFFFFFFLLCSSRNHTAGPRVERSTMSITPLMRLFSERRGTPLACCRFVNDAEIDNSNKGRWAGQLICSHHPNRKVCPGVEAFGPYKNCRWLG